MKASGYVSPGGPGGVVVLSRYFLDTAICNPMTGTRPEGEGTPPTVPQPGVTSACSAAGADAQHRGGVFHGGRRGLQHSLHVLVLRGILRVAQALRLAQRCWRAAGELAGLQDQK